jgi:histidinol-phosphatase
MSNSHVPTDLKDDLAFAHALADLADAISLDRYQAQDLVVSTKPDSTPVTDADRAVETAIREAISMHRSEDGLVGEEFGSDKGASSRYWVIDPIDGTKNFMRGVPIWATLIALVEIDSSGVEEVVVGVVSAPALSRRWSAARGLGAHVRFYSHQELNEDLDSNESQEKRIKVSKVSSISDASISYSDFVGWGSRLEPFQKMLNSAWRTRAIGDFWSHMLVAEGSIDVAIEPSLALWDMAALEIIVREAGGVFTDISGHNGPFGSSAISTNGLLHNEVVNGVNP